MIGFLSGLVRSLKGSRLLLIVNDVGYAVNVPVNLKPDLNQKIDFYIHTHVREDEITLYGFDSNEALDLFEKLLTVSGIGPKSALAILSAGSHESVRQAIEQGNLNFFTAISGIGKKSAQRLIIELRPKLSRLDADLAELEGNPILTDALRELGFRNNEIVTVMGQINPQDSLADQIKKALRLLKS